MSVFTGILGTSASQPGNFQLGAGPASIGGIPVQHDVNVIDSSSFSIDMTLWQRFGPTATVSDTIHSNIDRVLTVSHTIDVADGISGGPATQTILTQEVIEILYIGIPATYLTQQIVEVLYRPAPAFTITDSIDVSQTITPRNDTIRKTISQSLTPVQTIGIETSNQGKLVIQSVNVSDSIIAKGDRHITLTHNIGITPTLQQRNTNVRITVSDSITPGQNETPTYYPPQTVNESATVGQQLGWTPHKQIVNQNVSITDSFIIREQTTLVQHAIFVIPSILFATNTHVFSDTVSVSQTINETFPRVTIQDDINVSTAVTGGSSIRPITVRDHIFVSSVVLGKGITSLGKTDTVLVNQLINQASENTTISFEDVVNVNQVINNHIFDLHVHDYIDVISHIRIWNLIVPIVVSDSITAYSYSTRSVNPIRITVKEEATVEQICILSGVPLDNEQQIQHNILVFDNILRAGQNRQVVRDIIHIDTEIDLFIHKLTFILGDIINVTDKTRCNFNSQTLAQAITIADRQVQKDQLFNHKISVNQKIHRTNEQELSQSVNVQQTISASKIFKPISLIDLNPISDSISRPMIWEKHCIDIMELGPDYFEIRDPLIGIFIVPALVGTIMRKTPSVYLVSRYGQVILPPPEFGDAHGTTISTALARTITGRSSATVKNSRRELFKWAFVLGQLKALELRRWLVKNLSEVVTVTDWEGRSWIGRITSNPFTLDFQARWEGEVEKVVVDLEFQVLPIGG